MHLNADELTSGDDENEEDEGSSSEVVAGRVLLLLGEPFELPVDNVEEGDKPSTAGIGLDSTELTLFWQP